MTEDSAYSDEHEEEINPTPVNNTKKKYIAGLVAAVSVVAVILGVTQQSSANKQVSDLIASADTNAAAIDAIAWIPDGYTVFDLNPDIAQDPNYSGGTCEGTGYCWIYQIASKTDCSTVVGTIDMTNGTTDLGSITGEVSDVSSGSPTLLEINAGENSAVDSSTKGHLTSIECKA